MLSTGEITLHVTVPYTQLSTKWQRIIKALVESPKGLGIKVRREDKEVSIKVRTILFRPDGWAYVSFDKLGRLNDENEPAIIKEQIRQLLDTRHY